MCVCVYVCHAPPNTGYAATLRRIVEAHNHDIRACINTLQFWSQRLPLPSPLPPAVVALLEGKQAPVAAQAEAKGEGKSEGDGAADSESAVADGEPQADKEKEQQQEQDKDVDMEEAEKAEQQQTNVASSPTPAPASPPPPASLSTTAHSQEGAMVRSPPQPRRRRSSRIAKLEAATRAAAAAVLSMVEEEVDDADDGNSSRGRGKARKGGDSGNAAKRGDGTSALPPKPRKPRKQCIRVTLQPELPVPRDEASLDTASCNAVALAAVGVAASESPLTHDWKSLSRQTGTLPTRCTCVPNTALTSLLVPSFTCAFRAPGVTANNGEACHVCGE